MIKRLEKEATLNDVIGKLNEVIGLIDSFAFSIINYTPPVTFLFKNEWQMVKSQPGNAKEDVQK